MSEQAIYAPHEVGPEAAEQAVIVEITQDGAARIRECPPGVVVMMVESRERPEQEVCPTAPQQRKRSIGAGKRRFIQLHR